MFRGTVAVPNFFFAGATRLPQEMEGKTILHDVSAVFKPGTTTLVLGPPGCGKVRINI